MEKIKRVLSEESPDTLTTMHSLSYTLQSEGYSLEALHLIQTDVLMRTQITGLNNRTKILLFSL